MSYIKNLIQEPEHKTYKSKNAKNAEDGTEEEKKPRPIIKSATDLQRLKLEKLMKNPDKPIFIPEPPREKDYMQTVPSFVRNVMGSSAGAGSGEFHVYRHLRRKEYARQKTIQAKSMREQLNDEYQQKLDDNRRKAEEKTAKKRAKRLKRKQRAKMPKTEKNAAAAVGDEKDEETSDEDEQEDIADVGQNNVEQDTSVEDENATVYSGCVTAAIEDERVHVAEKNENATIADQETTQNTQESVSAEAVEIPEESSQKHVGQGDDESKALAKQTAQEKCDNQLPESNETNISTEATATLSPETDAAKQGK